MNVLDHIDTEPFESAIETVVEVISDTVTDEVIPAARRSATTTRRTVTRHPKISVGAIVTAVGLVALVLWMRSRSDAGGAEVTELDRSAA